MYAPLDIDGIQFMDMAGPMLDDCENWHEKDEYFYQSDPNGSRAQSQTCLSYAEMQQSVQSNHLVSASWKKERFDKPFASGRADEARSGIPNSTNNTVQHLPYGALFVDQRTTGYHERFRFTGKERDEETGYGYFGARYMDHELMTMWLSVDPMSDKYPNISPYAYCAWNPVKLVDPDGRKIKGVTYNPQTGEYSYTKAARRVGVDRYIEARCRTVSGRKSVQRMISSPTKFRIRVIDKPIVLPDGNGKVNQLSGIVLRGNYILISTADKVTVDEGKSGFDAVYVDGRNIVEENFKVKVSDLVSNPDESEFEEAYRLTEMEEFEKQYPYQTEEQKIHGIGAHEETHALDNGSEADALNNEKKERLEYIKEVLQ